MPTYYHIPILKRSSLVKEPFAKSLERFWQTNPTDKTGNPVRGVSTHFKTGDNNWRNIIHISSLVPHIQKENGFFYSTTGSNLHNTCQSALGDVLVHLMEEWEIKGEINKFLREFYNENPRDIREQAVLGKTFQIIFARGYTLFYHSLASEYLSSNPSYQNNRHESKAADHAWRRIHCSLWLPTCESAHEILTQEANLSVFLEQSARLIHLQSNVQDLVLLPLRLPD